MLCERETLAEGVAHTLADCDSVGEAEKLPLPHCVRLVVYDTVLELDTVSHVLKDEETDGVPHCDSDSVLE